MWRGRSQVEGLGALTNKGVGLVWDWKAHPVSKRDWEIQLMRRSVSCERLEASSSEWEKLGASTSVWETGSFDQWGGWVRETGSFNQRVRLGASTNEGVGLVWDWKLQPVSKRDWALRSMKGSVSCERGNFDQRRGQSCEKDWEFQPMRGLSEWDWKLQPASERLGASTNEGVCLVWETGSFYQREGCMQRKGSNCAGEGIWLEPILVLWCHANCDVGHHYTQQHGFAGDQCCLLIVQDFFPQIFVPPFVSCTMFWVILAGSPQDVHNVSSTSGMDPQDPGSMAVPEPSRERVSNPRPGQEQDVGNHYGSGNDSFSEAETKAAQEKI